MYFTLLLADVLLSLWNLFVGWRQLLCGDGLPMMTAVAYVECSLMHAVQTANFQEMIVLWCGASVHTASIFTALSNGSTLNRWINCVPCVDKNGSSKNDQLAIMALCALMTNILSDVYSRTSVTMCTHCQRQLLSICPSWCNWCKFVPHIMETPIVGSIHTCCSVSNLSGFYWIFDTVSVTFSYNPYHCT